MKKALFLSVILAFGLTGFAQTKNQAVKAPAMKTGIASIYPNMTGNEFSQGMSFSKAQATPSTHYRLEGLDEFETMITRFDLQSNGFVSNRMARFDDGSVGVTAIWASQDNASDRGSGYNFYDGEDFGAQPTERVEQEKTGWPTYAQYGANGEILISHTGEGLVCYTRENKGQGEWVRHEIPNPNLGLSAQVMKWPRVVTSGPNHSIINIIAADQDSGNNAITYIYYAKSTDCENWTVSLLPTLQEDGEETTFRADRYAIAANGNTVAVLLTGCVWAHSYVIKSEDNGETWTKIKVWDNPYAGMDWSNDLASIFDDTNAMYGPETGAICIDNSGTVHCAFSTHRFYHKELGLSYMFSYGMAIDGIFYWNDRMYPETNGTITPPVWDYDGDNGHVHIEGTSHDCFRMWWPADPTGDYVARNFNQPLIGFIDPDFASDWSNDQFYNEGYASYFQGVSALPAICADESGTIAIAYSCPDNHRELSGDGNYYRGVFVSYIEPGYQIGDGEEGEGNYYINQDFLCDGFMHMMEECIAVNSIQNTKNHEFWFSYQGDQLPGIKATGHQSEYTDNIIWAMKVVPDFAGLSVEEAVNPMTNVQVYPNPASNGQITFGINASQAAEMNIAIFNITGQKVMEQNVNACLGMNETSINISSLTSGIYFATVKANGFENTVKFIVK